jgi:hypothetical protein
MLKDNFVSILSSIGEICAVDEKLFYFPVNLVTFGSALKWQIRLDCGFINYDAV